MLKQKTKYDEKERKLLMAPPHFNISHPILLLAASCPLFVHCLGHDKPLVSFPRNPVSNPFFSLFSPRFRTLIGSLSTDGL